MRPGLIHGPSDFRALGAHSLLYVDPERRKLSNVPQEVGSKLEQEAGMALNHGSGRWEGGAELSPEDVPALRYVTSQTCGAERETILDQWQSLCCGEIVGESPLLGPQFLLLKTQTISSLASSSLGGCEAPVRQRAPGSWEK